VNRRSFLQSLSLVVGVSPFVTHGIKFSPLAPLQDPDETLCEQKFQLAVSEGWVKMPINEVVVKVGETFLGTPYAANVLEAPGEEHLVVDMRALDCVTFYENALVIARCIKKNAMTFDDYKKELTFIRYRGGIINGYASRLHYTSDYLHDNERKGVWKLVTKELGGIPYKKKLDFMSTHPESYRQLRESDKVRAQIRAIEKEISARTTYYIPKNRVKKISDKIRDGDILGITTSIEGIDTSHTGIAVWQGKELHLMHAPLAGKRVQIGEYVLSGYLAANKRQTGIMVARPLEPV
jgi:hypothetical protein